MQRRAMAAAPFNGPPGGLHAHYSPAQQQYMQAEDANIQALEAEEKYKTELWCAGAAFTRLTRVAAANSRALASRAGSRQG